MSDGFKHNHYVPEWYQKRFMLPEHKHRELYYLNLKPRIFVDPKGTSRIETHVKRQGSYFCFFENDLYTTKLGSLESTEIEQKFFGEIDRKGREAVNFFSSFSHPLIDNEAYQDLLMYMCTQRFRTPKGLEWLNSQAGSIDKNTILNLVQKLRRIYGAVWTECKWLIADASKSQTKFIISDHPVTVYNRECAPNSVFCRGVNDPDVIQHGSHTIFPLSLDKILIFTNLSWIRNPYQSALGVRPNPNLARNSIFKWTTIQTLRHLDEQEVIEINFILKKRAYQYLAAAKEEWLYPEKKLDPNQWKNLGDGYLLMPDPRSVTFSGEIIIGSRDGKSATAYDEYGLRPWEPGFRDEYRVAAERKTFERFQGEFARLYGPYRRGRCFDFMSLTDEKDTIARDLKLYCERDTYAMYVIWRYLADLIANAH